MTEQSQAKEMLNGIIFLCKDNLKMSKSMVNCFNNYAMKTDRKFEQLEKQLADLTALVQKLEKRQPEERHVYSDEEIYRMKATMSWRRLHEKTSIPMSTLQYRYRKYKEYLKESGGQE